MNVILAIDTATENCSAALISMQGQLLASQASVQPRLHAQLILPMVDQLFANGGLTLADCQAIAFGRGPGAFTGVRIAASIAHGLALASDLPLLPVSDLAAMAWRCHRLYQSRHISVAIDARMQEVYWAQYKILEHIPVLVDREQVCPPQALVDHLHLASDGVGTGWNHINLMPEALQQQVQVKAQDFYPHAEDIAFLAIHAWQQQQKVDVSGALPVYLRDQVVRGQG